MDKTSEENFTVNLHTHTWRCKHASGTVSDYCREAVQQGIQILGISDHSPFPDGEHANSRMDYSELDAYISEINEARSKFPDLTILSGLEIDWIDKYGAEYYRDKFLGEAGLDYLIGGVHFISDPQTGEQIWKPSRPFTQKIVELYVQQAKSLMESGLIDYFAHPDIMTELVPDWTENIESAYRDIIQMASDLNLPIEINANGMRKNKIETSSGPRWRYPNPHFWKLVADCTPNIQIVIGSDAHHPIDLLNCCRDCLDLARSFDFVPCNQAIADKIITRRQTQK